MSAPDKIRLISFYLKEGIVIHERQVLQWNETLAVSWTVHLHLGSGVVEVKDELSGAVDYIGGASVKTCRSKPFVTVIDKVARPAPTEISPTPVAPPETDESGNVQMFKGRKKR